MTECCSTASLGFFTEPDFVVGCGVRWLATALIHMNAPYTLWTVSGGFFLVALTVPNIARRRGLMECWTLF